MKSEKELQQVIDQVGGQMSRWWSKLTRAVTAIGKLKSRQRRAQKQLDDLVEARRAKRRAQKAGVEEQQS